MLRRGEDQQAREAVFTRLAGTEVRLKAASAPELERADGRPGKSASATAAKLRTNRIANRQGMEVRFKTALAPDEFDQVELDHMQARSNGPIDVTVEDG